MKKNLFLILFFAFNIKIVTSQIIQISPAFPTVNDVISLHYDASQGNGGLIGIGAQSGNSRFEVVYTDYEDVSLKSSVARTGVTTNNKIDADLDTIAFKYSYAF